MKYARYTDGCRAGYLGVDVFFALSGFILAYNYPSIPDWPTCYAFLRKRVALICSYVLAAIFLSRH